MKYNKLFDDEIKYIIENHHFTAGKILQSNSNKYLLDYILEQTKFLPSNTNIVSRAFFVVNHRNCSIKCKECGKDLKNQNIKYKDQDSFENHFRKFCSVKCEMSNKDTLTKQKNTNIQKYGCEWTFQSDNNKEKSKATMKEKYGCLYAQQNKEIKIKQINTMLKKYGVKSYIGTNDGKNKMIQSIRKNMYSKFSNNEFVQPMFSENDYLKYGDNFIYYWKCLKCGNEFDSFRNEIWFKEGTVKSYARCEKCYPVNAPYSESEKQLKKFIEDINQKKYQIKSNIRSIIKPYELDICLFQNKVVKIAIEYDGLYWHSDAAGTPKKYHLMKTELCEEKGIRLIHIFENEWLTKQNIVKSRLKSLFGIHDNVVFARKCEVKEVDSKTSKEFQERTHIQGSVNAKVNLGLFYKDKMIALMTFGKSRFNKKYEWELLRFCTELEYHIPGGASKLLKYFERNYNPKSLISYADRRWSQGKLYKALGFQLDHISKPDYWYVKNTNIYSRFKFQKHKLEKILKKFDRNKSEIENMHINNYKIIYDCGNYVFIKSFN